MDRPPFLYFFAAGQIKNKPADRSNALVNKEIGPDRSKFHVPQIACDDTYKLFVDVTNKHYTPISSKPEVLGSSKKNTLYDLWSGHKRPINPNG